jgi:hypothetical protein
VPRILEVLEAGVAALSAKARSASES